MLPYRILCILFMFGHVAFAQEVTHTHSVYHAFIENKGQWHDDVFFQSKFAGGNMWIQQHKFVFHLQDFSKMHAAHFGHNHDMLNDQLENREHVVHVNFRNSNRVEKVEKTGKTTFYYNYFIGNNPKKWASDVHGYSQAILKELYKGIDLHLIEQQMHLKYEFHLAPRVDPAIVQLEIAGASTISLDSSGNLHIQTPAGNIMEEKPYAYQIKNGKIIDIDCHFVLSDSIVSFQLGLYDPTLDLVIDPTLIFATYSGSLTDNFGMTATYAHDGSAYAGGTIYGNNYPIPDSNAFNITPNFSVISGNYGITDVVISKYASDGSTMLWSSFLGGGNNVNGTETVHSMICDSLDNIYFFGATSSPDFPIQNGYQTTHAGGVAALDLAMNGVHFKNFGTDMYVAKLSADGHTLMGSTFFGGSANDGVNYREGMPYGSFGIYGLATDYDTLTPNYGDQFRGEIMLDSANNCIVASCTHSTDFPILDAFQPAFGGGVQDGVIFKLSSDMSTLLWSSYYGGSKDDVCNSVKVDTSGNVLVGGGTASNDLLGTAGGWQSSYNGGKSDGFILKITPDGQTILQASYVGTANSDIVFMVDVNRVNEVYLLGSSPGGDFLVLNSGYANTGSSQFIARLDSNLLILENSTVFGNGSSFANISPSAFMVDICGNMYVSGWGGSIFSSTSIPGMPLKDPLQSTPPGMTDFYLFALKYDWSDMLFGSYLGGNLSNDHVDGGTSRFDKNGIVYQSVCGGCPQKSDFDFSLSANQNLHSTTNNSNNCNNLVFKLDFNLMPHAEITADQVLGCAPFTVQFSNFSPPSDFYLWNFGNGELDSTTYSPVKTYNEPGIYTVVLTVIDSICLLADSATITITVTDSITLSTSPDLVLCTPVLTTFNAFTTGLIDTFLWSSMPDFSDTLYWSTTDPSMSLTPSESTTYYVKVWNQGCSKTDSIKVDFIGSSVSLSGKDSLCVGQTTLISVANSNPLVNFTYVWSPDSIIVDGQNTGQVNVQPTVSQWLIVHATTLDGSCTAEDSLWIEVGSLPDSLLEATVDQSIVFIGSEVELHAEPSGYQYSWSPSDLVNFSTHQTTTSQVDESTTFTVSISNEFCTKTASVWVEALPFVCAEPFIYIPNAFTPNSDGENDEFRIYGNMIYSIILRIYNRWGELVFETNERHAVWDGTYQGEPLAPDVYDYYLQVNCIDGIENIIKGNVTLMR